MEYHPNIDPRIVDKINESEDAGGIFWSELPEDAIVTVRTRNTVYTLDKKAGTIQGHPEYCPEPTKFTLHGSTFGGSMIKVNWLGPGMYMEFSTIKYDGIVTSQIQHVNWARALNAGQVVGSVNGAETPTGYYERKIAQAKEIILYFAGHAPFCDAFRDFPGTGECNCGYNQAMKEFEAD